MIEQNKENKEFKKTIKLVNGIIKIILSDEENIFKSYLKYLKNVEGENKEEIFKPIIIKIKKKLRKMWWAKIILRKKIIWKLNILIL